VGLAGRDDRDMIVLLSFGSGDVLFTFTPLPTTRGVGLAKVSREVELVISEWSLPDSLAQAQTCDFSHASQECCVNVLCEIWQAHISSTPSGKPGPTIYCYRTIASGFSVSLECQVY
jgi:hypothetical protein